MDRRTFLRRAARWALAVPGLGSIAAACTGGGSNPSGSPTLGPSSKATPAGGLPWAQLIGKLKGSVIRPRDPAYRNARLDYDPRFDDVRPAAIVFAESERDVSRTIAFAGENHLPFAVRCGGHSYAGYSLSEGIVLDVSRVSGVRAGPGGLATIGAGASLIDVASELASAGVMVPGGTCATVGISASRWAAARASRRGCSG